MKRVVWLCAFLVLALVPVAIGCGSGTSGAPVEGPTTFYELRVSHHIPASAPPALAVQEWAETVEAATNGRVRFTIYPAESLVRGSAAFDATEHGICDVALINLAYAGQELSLNSVLTLGSLALPSERGTEIWDGLLEGFPEIAAEMSGVKVLGKSLSTSTALHVEDREIRVPDDIEGLKIGAMGENIPVLEAAGAIPVRISPSGWDTAAEKGVIVGCMAAIFVVTDRGLEAAFDSHLDLGLGRGGNVVVMNWKTWNRLPADVQATIDGLTPWLGEALRDASLQVEIEGWQKCEGQTVVRPTAEELELWMACYEPTAEQWIRDNAGKGPSQEIYDYLKAVIQEYRSGS